MRTDSLSAGRGLIRAAALLAMVVLSPGAAWAQDGSAPSSGLAEDPVPYYVGASEGLTHDSNVYRIPSGPSDTYSSTSLLGGFDQAIGRQRIFGTGTVAANRYFEQTGLDHTSYHARLGADWSTIEKLSGNVSADVGQSLSAPVASAAASGTPGTQRDLVRTQNYAGRAVWGGDAALTLQANAGYSKIDYSLPSSAPSDASETTFGLGAFYRLSGALKLGLQGHTRERREPQALLGVVGVDDPANDVRENAIELAFDYDRGGWLRAAGHVGYARQRNSNPATAGADYSGAVGRIDLDDQLSGKLAAHAYVARDTSLNGSLPGTRGNIIPSGSGTGGTGTSTSGDGTSGPASTASNPYENAEITSSVGVGLSYAATSKLTAGAGGRYARSRLLTASIDPGLGDTDVYKSAYLTLDYAISRDWLAACRLTHDARRFSGGVDYSYVANTVGCLAQFTLR